MSFFNFLRRCINYAERITTSAKSRETKPFSSPYLIIGDSLLFKNFFLAVKRPSSSRPYLTIGNNCMIGGAFIFESPYGEITIGDRVYLADCQAICINKIEIENDVFISWGVYFFDNDSHSLNFLDRIEDMNNHLKDWRAGEENLNLSKNWSTVKSAPIKICKHAWIGMECKILKGVTIGEGAIVGAGSVVTKDVAPWTVVGGNPATLIRTQST
jgi:acetyltransferase-like isoleucine patch superfamily enzyme